MDGYPDDVIIKDANGHEYRVKTRYSVQIVTSSPLRIEFYHPYDGSLMFSTVVTPAGSGKYQATWGNVGPHKYAIVSCEKVIDFDSRILGATYA